MWPASSKCTEHHLPKRDELLLCTVFALPKASSRMPDSSADSVDLPLDPEISARHDMHSFVVSVFPAPDSPEMSTDCAPPVRHIEAYAAFAILKTCGGSFSTSSSSIIDASVSAEQHSSILYGLTAIRIGPIAV